MKHAQIEVGKVYYAKVSGKLTKVRVDRIREDVSYGRTGKERARWSYDVTNLATNRQTTFRSASKFRGPDGSPSGAAVLALREKLAQRKAQRKETATFGEEFGGGKGKPDLSSGSGDYRKLTEAYREIVNNPEGANNPEAITEIAAVRGDGHGRSGGGVEPEVVTLPTDEELEAERLELEALRAHDRYDEETGEWVPE